MKKGKAVRPGATIGVIAPAGQTAVENVILAKESIEALGFSAKIGSSCFEYDGGFVAGLPEKRAHDVHAFFADPEVDAIMCLRGGYGTMQILPLLDYDLISRNPKLFVGFSDITALHTAIRQNAGLITLHGPMATSPAVLGNEPFSQENLLFALSSTEPIGCIQNPPGEDICCLVGGSASGAIVGGNVALLTATLGTPYEIDTKGKLLFLEDVNEEPYKIDRMLTQMAMAGKLEEATGFIHGTWTNCQSQKYPDGPDAMQVIREILLPYQKPTIYNVQAGHGRYNITLPLGAFACLDANSKILVIEESAATC